MPTINRIQYHRYGGPELMKLESFELASPGTGEVLVRVNAAAANPMDWTIRNGVTKMQTGRHFPRGLGHDFAGIVEQVGAGVNDLRAGDEVLGAMTMKASGAYAEMVLADARLLVKKPTNLSFEEAAAVPTVGVTAWQALIGKGRLKPGQSVFINGVLGGVGRSAAQLARMVGANVTGSCRDASSDEAKALGLSQVVGFDFDKEKFKDQFDVILTTAGTLTLGDARTMLKRGGRFVDINVTPAKLAKSLFARDFKPLIAKYTPDDLGIVARAASEGKLVVPIARKVPLSQGVEALVQLERNHTPKGGKLIITMQS